MPLTLRHILKNNEHAIPFDADAALSNAAFAVYRDEQAGSVTHIGLGWRLHSTQTGTVVDGKAKKGKYEGHTFELLIPPEHIDKAIAALQWAKEQMNAKEGEADTA